MQFRNNLGTRWQWRPRWRPTHLAGILILIPVALALEIATDFNQRRRLPEVRKTCEEAAKVGRQAATPRGLEPAASALLTLGKCLHETRRPLAEVERAYREAAEAGRQAATPRGLEIAAKALANLERLRGFA